MKLFSAFKNFLFNASSHLCDAIWHRDMKLFLRLLEKGADVNNLSKHGFSPLIISFMYRPNTFTLLLLEHHADPNLKYTPSRRNPLKSKLTIQFIVNEVKTSSVKLLALYGAKSIGVKFSPYNLFLKNLIDEKYKIYQQRIALEEKLNEQTSLRDHVETLTQLSELWEKQCANEQEPIYLLHYQKKAAYYQQKIRDLKTDRFEYKVSAYQAPQILEDQKLSESARSQEHELEPLLKSTLSSKLKLL